MKVECLDPPAEATIIEGGKQTTYKFSVEEPIVSVPVVVSDQLVQSPNFQKDGRT